MHKLTHKHYLYAAGMFLLASVAGLWSWNTLSVLFDLPRAQYRHVLAASVLLLILRWVLFTPGRGSDHRSGGRHEHQAS